MPIINVSNAEIKTASLEIKSLTVNNRQVTLSVFRQVQEEELINYETMKLNGIPWGNINYFWKDNGNESYFHILWQKGTELRRSIIGKIIDQQHQKWFSEIKKEISDQNKIISEYFSKEFSDHYFNTINKETHCIPYLENKISELMSEIDLFNDGKYDYASEEGKLNDRLESHKKGYTYYEDEISKLTKLKEEGKIETIESYRNKNILTLEEKISHIQCTIEDAMTDFRDEESNRKRLISDLNRKVNDFTLLLKSLNDLPQLYIAI